MNLEIVILAAGQGTRMKSALPKVLHALGGKPLLARVIETAKALDPAAVHVVIGHGSELVQERLADYEGVNWVLQAEQLGTGHAVAQVLPFIDPGNRVLVLYGDVPLTSTRTLVQLLGPELEQRLALLTTILAEPRGYGRIERDEAGHVRQIIEEKDASEAQRSIQEVNTGILAAPAHKLATWLPQLSAANAQGEYYLTDTIAMAVDDGTGVEALAVDSVEEVQGINSRSQLAQLERWYQRQLAEQLMAGGATLADPARIDIRGDLECGQDAFLDINLLVEGRVSIGNQVTVGPNVVLKNARIADGANIHANSIIEDSVVGENCEVGPFARLRPGSRLDAKARVGNFVEIKKAHIGPGSKVNHLSYVGDAELGRDVNIGAGTITCNYDGANKHLTRIGDNVFVGSNTALVAPINVERNSTIGAGSTLSNDVEGGTLTVERGRTRVIREWQRPTRK